MIDYSKLISNVSIISDSFGRTYLFDYLDNENIYGRRIKIKYKDDEYKYQINDKLIKIDNTNDSIKEIMRVDIN